MVVNGTYNIVDSIFVGKGVGPNGIAAVNLVFPVQLFLIGAGSLLGIGAASMISIRLGEKREESAERLYSSIVYLTLILALLITLFGQLMKESIIQILGTNSVLWHHTDDYLSVVLSGVVFILFPVAMNNILRSQGYAKEAMSSMLISAMINIALDPILIFGFDMGTRGAAMATVMARAFSMIYLVHVMFFSRRNLLKFRPLDIVPEKTTFTKAMGIGSASFVRQVSGSILALLLNNKLISLGGEGYVAAYAVFQRFSSFLFLPILGLGQGAQPLLGYSFGAKDHHRLKMVFKTALVYSTALAAAGCMVMVAFPKQIFSIFLNDMRFIGKYSYIMKIMGGAFFAVGIHVMVSTYFQSIGRIRETVIVSGMRQLLLFLPLMYTFGAIWGIRGVIFAFPVSDVAAAMIVMVMYLRFEKKRSCGDGQVQRTGHKDT